MRFSILSFVFAISLVASALRADLYEFAVTGRVEGGFLAFYHLGVGDEITFRYTLDSNDHDASNVGRYAGTTSVFETPAGKFSGDPEQGGSFTVQPTGQFVSFDSFMPSYPIKLSFRFPEQTLLTDELPLTLPISASTTRSFFVHPLSIPSLFGSITSYESRLVPDPNSLCVLCVACAVLGRRRI